MLSIVKNIIYIVFCLTSVNSVADNLEPEDSIFSKGVVSEYHSMVVNYLSEIRERNIRVSVIVMPSFQPEYGLGIKETEGEYSIIKVKPEKMLWQQYILLQKLMSSYVTSEERAMLEKDLLNDDPMKLKKVRCSTLIEKNLAQSIISVWQKMLFQTQYQKEKTLWNDAVTYHFSMIAGRQIITGKLRSPDAGFKTGKLIKITKAMEDLCQSKTKYSSTKLKKLVEALAAQLTKA